VTLQLDTLTLPDLIIQDEFQFSGVGTRVSHSLAGTPIIWQQEEKGQPITLVGSNDSGWIPRSDLEALFALTRVPKATYVLIYENRSLTVRFRHEEPPVITATPVNPRPNSSASDFYHQLLIKFMEVN